MSVSSPDEQHHHRKKRVGKACDLCRIKKTKCDGKKPCTRCVADNQLCAFSEKRKPKEKAHPAGYIELLEARIDFLTRSLQKVITMAEPHLPFLQQIMEQARLEHSQSAPLCSDDSPLPSAIPINEVVNFLISDPDFMPGQLPETMHRADAAANTPSAKLAPGPAIKDEFPGNSPRNEVLFLDPTSDGVDNLGQQYDLVSALNSGTPAAHLMRLPGGSSALDSRSLFHRHGSLPPSRSSSSHLLLSSANEPFSGLPASSASLISGRGLHHEAVPNGGAPLNSPPPETLASELASLDSIDHFSQYALRSSLLFLNNGGTVCTSPLSVSSLSIKLESQNFNDLARHSLRRLHSGKAHVSAASIKKKNSGHVHKPQSVSHSPQIGSANILPSAASRQEPGPAFPALVYPYLQTALPDLGLFGFENDHLFDEPPSKVIADGLPSFLALDDLGMTNPFMSPYT
ncbi:hypothetical protein METBIDRAFT_11563 [Metschnikowia bicuspidata var. bicuspidata NRRL YB-4993]|uniref:Zn(2)-C6 fungal-type domain-containing protein n=1 Tax=Metschnikowia bicuspidata var. bicuspidata NRRL YB-4993 TaxID=869754 RepID=A0A1A0HAQ9_9ASCO|nr:hypothetical protein METBIDRAFT_11563 [Metschnikowia bicuspidata var. bicuspidata NRRL YB-4993]OBA20967.1 hypothetical protein METBIDRAFT_11563 [Metschnikowia bicuspidata var. bicuspidata NRRL YB-4993]